MHIVMAWAAFSVDVVVKWNAAFFAQTLNFYFSEHNLDVQSRHSNCSNMGLRTYTSFQGSRSSFRCVAPSTLRRWNSLPYRSWFQ